jgi:hypothetical protein
MQLTGTQALITTYGYDHDDMKSWEWRHLIGPLKITLRLDNLLPFVNVLSQKHSTFFGQQEAAMVLVLIS